MLRRILPLLLLFATAPFGQSQNPSTPQVPTSSELTESAPMPRPGPPPAGASATELEVTADQLRAHNLLGDALDYYSAALKRGGDAAMLHNKIGIAQLSSTHPDRARKEFEQSIKLKPDYATAYNNLGAAWYAKAVPHDVHHSINDKDVRRAIQYYEEAIKLNDDDASFHRNLGVAYFDRKEYDKASEEFQRALQIDPTVFDHRSKAGIQALMMTQSDRATFNYYLARLYAKTGSFDQALVCLRKAMEDGYKKIDQVYTDTNFAALRKDPRFNELMNAKPAAIPQ